MERFFLPEAEEFRTPMSLGRRQSDELGEAASVRGVGVFRLNGVRMSNQAELFQEFKVKLQFPDYFGSNWNALDECLADLDWLDWSDYLVVIESGNSVLCDEEVEVREMLDKILTDISEEWSNSGSGVVFRTILVID